jgi:hypothetical protein
VALAIYARRDVWGLTGDWSRNLNDLHDQDDPGYVAARLVERGARLRDVAAAMNIPMALRSIKPGVAHLADRLLCQNPELLTFMPSTTPKQRIWLRLVTWAFKEIDPEFGTWVAQHVAKNTRAQPKHSRTGHHRRE